MTTGTTVAAFDVETGQRIIKAVRQVEAAGVPSPPSMYRSVPVPMEIIVPTAYDDGTGIYTVDVYTYDPATESLVLVLEDQTAELLPDSI